ncbi:hypothetical protein F4859DRAFT_521957 [Xylaria cf. heliscus]|nr:hypothetical protein F4859DRAFT_521957 [Xylaria cf. heliscus]
MPAFFPLFNPDMPKEREISHSPRLLLVVAAASAGLCLVWEFLSVAWNRKQSLMAGLRAPISVLSLSQNRTVVRAIHDHIVPRGFTIGGILESNPFSSNELTLALKLLEPRPQVILVGRGYTEDETSLVRQVFANYMADVGIEKGTVIKITSKVFNEVKKDGVPG